MAETVGERMMTGVRLQGGVGGLGGGMSGLVDSEFPSSSLVALLNWWSGIGRRGKGARILGGRCSSRTP